MLCNYCRETVEDCGTREISEETGLILKNVKTECILNVIWLSEKRHFLSVVLHGEVDNTKQKEPDTLEPDKCEGMSCFVNLWSISTGDFISANFLKPVF